MILLYSHSLTPRLAYTAELVFRSVLGWEYRLSDDVEEYRRSGLPKLAYTAQDPGAGLFLESGSLLFEQDIRPGKPSVVARHRHLPVFFKSGGSSLVPYDVFATVFYIASRYEEYLPFEADKHGRFQAEQSLLCRHGILQRPFLNELIADFADTLRQHFPALAMHKRPFRFLSTIDIDNAFAYAHKGFIRNAAGLLKDLLSLNFKKASQRLAASRNDAKDPYHTFGLIHSLGAETGTSLQYFTLIGDYAAYDKNPAHSNGGFRKLLGELSAVYPMGLHPSYQSSAEPERIAMEKGRLEAATGKTVTAARCHFLRVRFPETYRRFIKAGITDDYTMIFASQCGFRTGLCIPYKWFDLERNEATSLLLHTSAVMEGTLRDYNKLSAGQAQELCRELMAEVKKYGGEFISIFHNDSFVPEQKEWIAVYKDILQESRKPGANH